MLKSLIINNFVIIEHLQLNVCDKLTVISGETGAGKSLIIDAVCFVCNLNVKNSNILKKDCDKGFVVAEFAIEDNIVIQKILSELDIEYATNIILRRTINSDNKTKGFINDIPVTLATLKKIGVELVELSAQFEAMKLFKPKFYLNYIDQYADLEDQVIEMKKQYNILKELNSQLSTAQEFQERQAQEQDYLKFVVNELNDLNPILNEEANLQQQRIILSKQAKIKQFLTEVNGQLEDYNGIIPQILSLQKIIIRNQNSFENLELSKCSDHLDGALEQLNQVSILLNNSFESDYSSLEDIEQRILALRSAARKYRINADELINYRNQIIEKINDFDNLDNKIVDLEQNIANQKNNFFKFAESLSIKRIEAAQALAILINEELGQLNMQQVTVKIDHQLFTDPNPDGIDQFEFLIRTNQSGHFGKIADIASGGELSRLILILKVLMANNDTAQLLIFDEIDTGLSGATASKIGRKLKELSNYHQIILITHQPQIAALANQHLLVFKNNNGTNVKYLNNQEHIYEVARLISGEIISNEATRAAEKLVEEAISIPA